MAKTFLPLASIKLLAATHTFTNNCTVETFRIYCLIASFQIWLSNWATFREPFSLFFLEKNEARDAFSVPALTTLLCLSLFIFPALLHLVCLCVCVWIFQGGLSGEVESGNRLSDKGRLQKRHGDAHSGERGTVRWRVCQDYLGET